jgi:hypothetical protein
MATRTSTWIWAGVEVCATMLIGDTTELSLPPFYDFFKAMEVPDQ